MAIYLSLEVEVENFTISTPLHMRPLFLFKSEKKRNRWGRAWETFFFIWPKWNRIEPGHEKTQQKKPKQMASLCPWQLRSVSPRAESADEDLHFFSVLYLALCLMGNFLLFFVNCRFFFKNLLFSNNDFRNNIQVSNSLDPDQAGHFVRPDLGPKQRLSADCTRR